MKKIILIILLFGFGANVFGADMFNKTETISFKYLSCDRQNDKNIAIDFVKQTEKNYLIDNVYCYNGKWAIDLKHKK